MRDLRRILSSSFELVSRPTSMYLAEACLAAAAQRSAERANSGAYSAEPSAPMTTRTVGGAAAAGPGAGGGAVGAAGGPVAGEGALKAVERIRRSRFIGIGGSKSRLARLGDRTRPASGPAKR